MLAVESNLGFEAAHNARYISEAGISHVEIAQEPQRAGGRGRTKNLAEHARPVTGVRTTNESKEQMYLILREALEQRTLRIYDHLLSEADPDAQVAKLVKQMHNYSAVHTDPSRVFAQTRRVFTGKSQGEQDDLLIALQLAILYRRVHIRNCAED